MFTGISSVAIARVPDIAVGDALGSCVFNLVMLVLLDELSRDEPLYRRIDQGHVLTAGFGIVLIGTVGAIILIGRATLLGSACLTCWMHDDSRCTREESKSNPGSTSLAWIWL